jgi:hypothetical protein
MLVVVLQLFLQQWSTVSLIMGVVVAAVAAVAAWQQWRQRRQRWQRRQRRQRQQRQRRQHWWTIETAINGGSGRGIFWQWQHSMTVKCGGIGRQQGSGEIQMQQSN